MEKMKHSNNQKENTSTETHGKDIIGSVMVLGGGIAGMQAWLNWTRHFPPMTVLCELSHPNWSRSAGILTSNFIPVQILKKLTDRVETFR